ncbi:MAG: DNA repair protein RecO [Coriobacteriales bacterium]|nr:DNA repair protein RecO [Coriobacteriales bacterium]
MGRRTTRVGTIVLGRTKLKEQDLILTMMDTSGTQVRAVAKGARKPGSRLAARTELFCECDMLLSWGRGLPIVQEAEVRNRHAHLSRDLELVAAGSAMCEVARLTCYEGIEDPYLYRILSRALDALGEASTPQNVALLVSAYAIKVASHCGWRPEVDACVACGEVSMARFSVAAGGVLCESCAKDIAEALPITQAHVEWIASLILSRFDVLATCEVSQETSTFLVRLAHSWCATHLDARLRAFEFYAGL